MAGRSVCHAMALSHQAYITAELARLVLWKWTITAHLSISESHHFIALIDVQECRSVYSRCTADGTGEALARHLHQ